MEDPFGTATAKVADLQDQHDKLERAIPKLQEIERGFQENLKILGGRETALMQRLEQLVGIIKARTTQFNAYIKEETDRLAAAKHTFHLWSTDKREKLEAREGELNATATAQNQRAQELTTKATEINNATDLLNSRIDATNKFSDDVHERASVVGKREEEYAIKERDQAERTKSLDTREAAVTANETAAAKLLSDASISRHSAATMLEKAKDQQATLDQRDTAQDRRDALMDGRERDLNALAIRLGDRQAVMETNAKLAP